MRSCRSQETLSECFCPPGDVGVGKTDSVLTACTSETQEVHSPCACRRSKLIAIPKGFGSRHGMAWATSPTYADFGPKHEGFLQLLDGEIWLHGTLFISALWVNAIP